MPKSPAGEETVAPARRSSTSRPAAGTGAAKPTSRAGAAKSPARAGAAKPAPRAKAAKPASGAARAAAPKAAAGAKPKRVTAPKATAETRPKRAAAPKPAAAPRAGADGAPARRSRRPKLAPDRLEQIVAAARTSLEEDKAENVLVLDVTGRADYADRLIIATGLVERQLQAMATHLDEALEKVGLKLQRSNIQASPDWVLIDAGDLVIHLFRPEARATYALERMWGPDSPKPEGDGPGEGAAEGA